MNLLALFLALMFAYSLASRRLERTFLTAPILFTAAGIVVGILRPDGGGGHGGIEGLLTVAELGLVLILFTDASRTDLRILRSIRELPVRLLTTGMLLTIALGLAAALAVLPGLSVWEAGALAAILAPTDAGLGLVIVGSPKVPVRIRQALNVEAGLNDGLSVPFLMFFMALALKGTEGAGAVLTRFAVEQLGFGALLGIGLGLIGGWLLGLAHRKEWMAHGFQRIGVVAVPLLCVLGSEPVGASMFIAAFVAGLAIQTGFKEAGRHSVELAEEWSQLLNLSVFFFFGIVAARHRAELTPSLFVYAALSLTVVRLLPVAAALRGTGLGRDTALFMGWFGPRGLASIVLGLIYLEQEVHTPGAARVGLAVIATVLVSIFAHGLTAKPGIAWYERRLAALGSEAPERQDAGARA
jgi:NhaP-type Na+/H+ or K+/H+ antiporter